MEKFKVIDRHWHFWLNHQNPLNKLNWNFEVRRKIIMIHSHCLYWNCSSFKMTAIQWKRTAKLRENVSLNMFLSIRHSLIVGQNFCHSLRSYVIVSWTEVNKYANNPMKCNQNDSIAFCSLLSFVTCRTNERNIEKIAVCTLSFANFPYRKMIKRMSICICNNDYQLKIATL